MLPPFEVPLAVRSPYLNCWGFLRFSDGYGVVTETYTNAYQHHYDWDPSLEARNFLTWHNTKTDCSLEI